MLILLLDSCRFRAIEANGEKLFKAVHTVATMFSANKRAPFVSPEKILVYLSCIIFPRHTYLDLLPVC